jgi:RNA-directed DNA polymerase
MKRVGNLWPAVVERGNLVRAFHQAARGKRHKMEVRRFAADLDGHLDRLRAGLIDETFQVGRFHVFKVYDPKERTIHAAHFEERVFHHALMNWCEPVLERQAVFHSYACRRGKGRLKAIEAALKAARRHDWHLKLDIRKYFESVPHDRLLQRLGRVFKDPVILRWFERIVRCHRGVEGRGLPIGSLTSQHLANFYLGIVDRHCLDCPEVSSYARYMDDFVCWGADRQELLEVGRRLLSFVADEAGLALKHPPCPQPTSRGMDFLGYRIFPDHAELNRRSKVRYRRRVGILAKLHDAGELSELAVQQRLTALTAFALPTASHRFRSSVWRQIRSAAIGLEPGEPGRQLEQQREQLPRREPQQQQPRQHEQQHRVSGGPQLRPRVLDGTCVSMGLNRPSSVSPLLCRGD